MTRIILMFLVFLSLNCQSSSLTQDLQSSVALRADSESPLVKALPPEGTGERSGFLPLISGSSAFDARIALVDASVTSLDIQYYIWHRDKTGKALMSRILDAAERGVRVRILLDDMNLGGDREFLAQIDRHPNIEVRLYNPISAEATGMSKALRGLEIVFDFERSNRRMHNKVMIADGSFTVIGGRNIGDEYFDLKGQKNFRDLDVLAAGPVSHELSRSFDEYWRSPQSFGLKLNGSHSAVANEKQWMRIREDYKITKAQERGRIFDHEPTAGPSARTLAKLSETLVWARAKAVYDAPMLDSPNRGLVQDLKKLMPEPRKEWLIESAYFIPPDALLKKFSELGAKGVKVRVLTNSLVSNDVLLAHAGYTGKREKILGTGADLFEWRNAFVKVGEGTKGGIYASRASLHSKVFVIDGEYLFIGSMNLDPRSIELNTEGGLMIQSVELAKAIGAFIEDGMNPKTSWKVGIACKSEEEDCKRSAKVLQWQGERKGRMVTLHTEPDSSFWKRFLTGGLELLPIEDSL